MGIRCRFPPQLVGTHDLFGQAGEEALEQLALENKADALVFVARVCSLRY